MANELTINDSISLAFNASVYPIPQTWRPQPTAFQADCSTPGGPTPGEILASKMGTNINLSALNQPGWCRIQNLGVSQNGTSLFGVAGQQYTWTNYIEIGIWDSNTQEFYPMHELLPGEFYKGRLSRFLGSDIGTGSGTAPGGVSKQLRVKAIGTACKVLVEVIER